jgi:hypothetical protein
MEKKKNSRIKLITDEQVSPYDKLGQYMLKKMKVKSVFKKHKKDQGVSQKRIGESIMTLEKFQKLQESREK